MHLLMTSFFLPQPMFILLLLLLILILFKPASLLPSFEENDF